MSDPLYEGVCDRRGAPFDMSWRTNGITAWHKCNDLTIEGHLGHWIYRIHYQQISELRALVAELEAENARLQKELEEVDDTLLFLADMGSSCE